MCQRDPWVQNKEARISGLLSFFLVRFNQWPAPLAGLTFAFLSVDSILSSERARLCDCFDSSLPDLAFFPLFFLLSVQEDFAEQQLLASALPWQQDDLLLVFSVLAFLSVHELLWADAVAPNKNRAPRRRICFILS